MSDILVIDNEDRLGQMVFRLNALSHKVTKFKIDGWNSATYMAPEPLLTEVSQLTASVTFDLIVIGNNAGVGLEVAKAINEAGRPKTLIIWYADSNSDIRPYQALGIRYFGYWEDFKHDVQKFFSGELAPILPDG